MQKIFKPIDNAPLIIFRIFFGLLLALESFGSIATGWVRKVFIEPEFTFSHIGFEWLQPLPGNGMYFYFVCMGLLGLLVMLGYKYRISLALFSVMWLGVYLMQKSSYNNHYYLLFLVCLIMLVLPANKYASFDAKNNPEIKALSMPQWCSWVMIFQIAIMYFFAACAKFYPDWLNGNFTRILFANHPYEFLNPLIQNHYFHLFIAYSGILFDFLIIPFFLIKKTRTIAFWSAVFFHLFNAIFLHIGIFPFFALSFVVFCYPPDFIRKLFFKKKPPFETSNFQPSGKKILVCFFIPYFLIQLFLPIRHWFIPHDVVWTEEGHRLSWRMMLRSRSGITNFRIIDKKTNTLIPYDYKARLTPKQQNFVAAYPDGIWQMAQIIKKEFEAKNQDVAVYVDSHVSINQGKYYPFINPEVDLSSVKWNHFSPNEWILIPTQFQ